MVFLNFVVSMVVLMVLAAGGAVFLGKRAFEGPGPAKVATTFLVKPNTGVAEIANQLESRGLISDARVFRLGVRAYGNAADLKAGEYEIKPGASMHEVMDLLKSGKSVMYSMTIPEGITVQQAFQRIAAQEALTGDMPAELPPEGSLAADTQRFTRGATRKSIIDKMLAHQKELVEDIWSRRAPDLPLADVNEFVTLASIVEKETGRGDERSRVAAVFINRLRKNMRLQSDPTIIYGLFGGAGKPEDRPIYQSDIDKPTPLQHLYDQRPAADADRQSWPRRAGGGGQSVEDERSLLRRRRHRWPRLCRHAGRAQRERRALSCHPEAAGRGGRQGGRGSQIDSACRSCRRDGGIGGAVALNRIRGPGMTLQSMTGFSRAAGEAAGTTAAWELKSVNGKTIETRLKLPQGLERLEQAARQAIQKRFARGNIQAGLTVARAPGLAGNQPVINEASSRTSRVWRSDCRSSSASHRPAPTAFWRCAACSRCRKRSRPRRPAPPSTAFALLLLEKALAGLEQSRRSEGAALKGILSGHIDQIEQLTARAEADPSREPERIRARLEEQVRLLIGAAPRSTRAGFCRRRRSSPPRPTSARRSTGCARIYPPDARFWPRADRSGASSISSRRNLIANQTLCAQSPMPAQSRRSGWS